MAYQLQYYNILRLFGHIVREENMLTALELSWSVDFILYFTIAYGVVLGEVREDVSKFLQMQFIDGENHRTRME